MGPVSHQEGRARQYLHPAGPTHVSESGLDRLHWNFYPQAGQRFQRRNRSGRVLQLMRAQKWNIQVILSCLTSDFEPLTLNPIFAWLPGNVPAHQNSRGFIFLTS